MSQSQSTPRAHETVLVLDFGSQYTQLIARRIREAGVYCEIDKFDLSAAAIRERAPGAIILSGGPSSVYDEGAPKVSADIFGLGIPVLGICYGLQLMAHVLGGKVVPGTAREYGAAKVTVDVADGPESFRAHCARNSI